MKKHDEVHMTGEPRQPAPEALRELIEKWEALAQRERRRSREANHAGNVELDAYRDGKSTAFKECAHDLNIFLSSSQGTPAPGGGR